jgi:hypothetical protein
MGSYVWNLRIRNLHIMWLKKGIRGNGFKVGRLSISINPHYKKEWTFFQVFK